MAIAPMMAAQSSEPAISQEVFITVIVDSSTPAWEELFNKYLRRLLQTVLHNSNAAKTPKQPRISYISYSSATSYASPIVKDMYFTRNQDISHASKTLSGTLQGTLQGPIARNLPDGGSAALEGLVRAVEHFDLLEELEPHSSSSPKHIFFTTSSPPDASQRPLWNNCEKFDHFGWKQCEEWLLQRSIALTMVTTRLPPNPTYISLYTSLNTGPVEPIPPTGPVRVFISRVLWENMLLLSNQNPNQPVTTTATASHSSPAIATGSPANAASPSTSRKRKAAEDAQESPRRTKFPPGTVGNPPVTNTPPPGPVGITTVTLPPNGSPLRSGSVAGTRTTASVVGAQVKAELQPTAIPNQAATNIGTQIPSISQQNQLLRNQNTGTNQPQSGSQALFPPQIAHSYAAASHANPLTGTSNNNASRPMTSTGPTDGMSFQNGPQIEVFASASVESQRERMMRLKNMMVEHERAIVHLQAENRLPEAKERMAQLEKIREFISVLVQTQRARMTQGVAQQNPAISAASSVGNVAAPLQNPNVPTAGPSRQSFQPGNASNAHDGAQNTLGSNMGANINNAFNPQLNGSRPPQNPVQPQNQFLWRGSLSITGQDGRRAGELLVFLNVMKANPQQQDALSAWPGKISMTPIRQHSPPDRLVTWLGQNMPEGLFSVRALELEHWQASQRTPENAIAIQEGMKKFSMAQGAIITNKLVLHGTVNLTTGGTVSLILIHAPTGSNGLGPSEPQIAIARYTNPPNLSTLPGVPLPNPSNVPAPGTWGVNPPAMAPTQPSTLPTAANSNPQNVFNNGSIGGTNPSIGPGSIGGNMAGASLRNHIGGVTGAAGGNNPHQLVSLLLNIGGPNLLNSAGGANNLDVNALLKNPQFMAQLTRYKQQQQYQQAQQQQHEQQQQQQMGLTMPASGLVGNSGMGNNGTSIAALSLSGASLLDRMNNPALARTSMSATSSGGNSAFGPAAASVLARQQFINSLSAHSSTVGAMNANNPAANNASSAAMFNQLNTTGYGLGGGINMAGGATGAHNLNINVGNSGSNGMGMNTDLLRRANLLANQRRISPQDALRALINLSAQQHGWNGGGAGG